jgi:serine/threonine protein kinase
MVLALEPGKQLGSFEISSMLGVGGMGEVYHAHDSKLDRDVAIKVLPAAFALDAERLGRFNREARLLASLDHPNICAVYDLYEEDGVQFMVMPLIEGDTLADRIERGPIPVSAALPIFAQIAEALEAAHEQGIIHRDLKPGNIKVSEDGKVKVLDFGLGKAIEYESDTASSDAPTRVTTPDSTKMSQEGVILGTPVYMSPEQARGKPVDKRTDIWAFGCCLYETLTGTLPHAGQGARTRSGLGGAAGEHTTGGACLAAQVPPEGLEPPSPGHRRRPHRRVRPHHRIGPGQGGGF